MDVPARMAFVMRAVPEEERTQAAVVTSLARSSGNALGPIVTGAWLASRSFQVPVILASVVKIAYDIGLYRAFRAHEATESARDAEREK
jgi:MFS family permease